MAEVFQGGAASFDCGGCGRGVSTTALWQQAWGSNEAGAVGRCPTCGALTLLELSEQQGPKPRPSDGLNDHFRVARRQFPEPQLITHDSTIVPESVGRRHRDAQRAFQSQLWEQTITTARTAVQVMARLEDVKRGSLREEIDGLIAKRGPELTELVRAMAHSVRDAGNDAAHPDDPDWHPTEAEAREALAFLEATMDWLFVLPARLRQDATGPTESESGET